MFDFSIVTGWIHGLLTSIMPVGLAVFLECLVIGVCIMLMYAVIAIIMIYMERKVCAAFQCRLGPTRVGPWGSIQVFADVFKMLIKEIITINHADKFLYNLAPYIVILASIMSFSCLPINKGMEVLDFNVGVFFVMAASSIGIVGILLAGWSSNNKYSLIGAMRSGAQMISYELSVGLSILTIIVLTDTIMPEVEKAIRKSRHTVSYRHGLHGYSNYHLIVLEVTTGRIIHNRLGYTLKRVLKSVAKSSA